MEALVIGEIVGVYGVKGWLKLRSWTQEPEQIFAYQPWRMVGGHKNEQKPCEVVAHRRHGNQFVISLAGINDRDQASELVKWRIVVDKQKLPTLPDDEFYWADLVGMRVVNLSGELFGVVDSLFETGANDILVINGDQQRLVPFIQGQVVTNVDRAMRQITVDWDADF